jgi:hypothetical protein
MSEELEFSSARLNKKPLTECELALECNRGNYRLYVDIDQERSTFHALAIAFHGCTSDGNVWDCPNLTIQPLFNLTAYFDGVRHLEFNRDAGDMAGYIYCPDMQGIIDMMTKVREIELDVCRDCNR